ncbi:hypothetical protein [Anaeroselena agilis]|uniref:Uncharacterized protein n=1 Tax=Anaeroselena agilis TaxID=3063788 RepID=A0ABU3NSP9_9FIRM|nr:hypothetical protein [Selenomonadales bacterium 4137-cl]
MKRLLSVLCVMTAGLLLMGAAPSIKSYQETFRMEADGAGKVSVRVEFAGLTPGTWEVPLTTWKGVREVEWRGVPSGVEVKPVLGGASPCLRLTVGQGAAAAFALQATYDVPAQKAPAKAKNQPPGDTRLALRFLNGGHLPIADYGLKVLLPPGMVVHSVAEKTPKGKGGAGAQIAYIKEDDRQGLTVAAKKLSFGDAAGAQVIAVKDRKSPVVIIVLGVIAVMYMVVFRDIVRPPSPPRTGA